MKYEDREVVDGTTVVIGRKVQFRKDAEGRAFTRVAKGYTAEYRDGEGKRRFVSLRTNHRREARRLAIELQQRLDDGQQIRRRTRLTMPALIERYTAFNESKSLMPTTLKKYRSDLEKLGRFCAERGVQHASQFTEERYHQFESWLRSQTHKQATTYSSKSVAANLVLTKQMFKWAHRHRLIADNPIASAAIPFAKAKEQPCFTTAQVEAMLAQCEQREGWQVTHDAIAILAYTGLRVNELAQLRWDHVMLDRGQFGMIRVARGGSGETTKSKRERVIPIFSRIRPIFGRLPRDDDRVLPTLRDRTLLSRIKRLCRDLGYGTHYRTHSLRHHFISWCCNEGLPVQQVLQLAGHASWSMVRRYYTLSDDQADRAVQSMQIRIQTDEKQR